MNLFGKRHAALTQFVHGPVQRKTRKCFSYAKILKVNDRKIISSQKRN
jgi:hypothetical protein